MPYVVETLLADWTWENTWSDEEGNPQTFPTELEALKDLEDFKADMNWAVEQGHLAEFNPDEYRVRFVEQTKESP